MFHSYAAIGDSFTEGVGDELPDGSVRGWTDLVAAGLAAGEGETIQYANLAIRGRLLEPIVNEQLPAALALSPPPTILTLNGGGNDMLRPGGDMLRLAELTERAIQRCLEAGVRMVLLSGGDPSERLPLPETVATAYDALDLMRGIEVFLNAVPGASLVAFRKGLRAAAARPRATKSAQPRTLPSGSSSPTPSVKLSPIAA